MLRNQQALNPLVFNGLLVLVSEIFFLTQAISLPSRRVTGPSVSALLASDKIFWFLNNSHSPINCQHLQGLGHSPWDQYGWIRKTRLCTLVVNMRRNSGLGCSGCFSCSLLHFGIALCTSVSDILSNSHNTNDIVLGIALTGRIQQNFNNMVGRCEQWELKISRLDALKRIFEDFCDRVFVVISYKFINKISSCSAIAAGWSLLDIVLSLNQYRVPMWTWKLVSASKKVFWYWKNVQSHHGFSWDVVETEIHFLSYPITLEKKSVSCHILSP
jgi:hypothetical protein